MSLILTVLVTFLTFSSIGHSIPLTGDLREFKIIPEVVCISCANEEEGKNINERSAIAVNPKDGETLFFNPLKPVDHLSQGAGKILGLGQLNIPFLSNPPPSFGGNRDPFTRRPINHSTGQNQKENIVSTTESIKFGQQSTTETLEFSSNSTAENDPLKTGVFQLKDATNETNFKKSACGPGEPNDQNGACKCDYAGKVNSRPQVYWPETKSCYDAFDQAPCKRNEWLFVSLDYLKEGKCEPRTCEENDPSTKLNFWIRHRGICYKYGTQGICQNPQEYMFFDQNFNLHCTKEKTEVNQVTKTIAGVGEKGCPPGHHKISDGACSKEASFD